MGLLFYCEYKHYFKRLLNSSTYVWQYLQQNLYATSPVDFFYEFYSWIVHAHKVLTACIFNWLTNYCFWGTGEDLCQKKKKKKLLCLQNSGNVILILLFKPCSPSFWLHYTFVKLHGKKKQKKPLNIQTTESCLIYFIFVRFFS